MTVKGWCPGAHRPMMSGDGLLVRIRPRLGRLTRSQALGLCDIAQEYGNAIIDLTSRANLQLRGVSESGHQAVLNRLLALNMLDTTPEAEARRNIITNALWERGDLTHRLHDAIIARLNDMPVLPPKMGIGIDTAEAPMLDQSSADFRFELDASGHLILRADGASHGRRIDEIEAPDALIAMANWFIENAGTARRMASAVAQTDLPEAWMQAAPRTPGPPMTPGVFQRTRAYGVPFGSLNAADLRALISYTNATALRMTPWRLFVLEDAGDAPDLGFALAPDDQTPQVHACPGAPACASATVSTRDIARALAPLYPQGLHVSGCAKGCAHPRDAHRTLVGRDGTFDLVEDGAPWDEPVARGLTAQDLMTMT